MDLVSKVTLLLALFTVFAQILVIFGIINLLTKGKLEVLDTVFKKLSDLVFVVPVIAMLGSLFFSEIAHYTPCVLCWYQRIAMYSQAIVLVTAKWRKDRSFNFYSIVLSVIGAVISTYHYLLQIHVIKEIVPCATTPGAVDCSQKTIMTFGYITIPMMALSAFLLIIVLQLHNLKANSK